MARNRADRRRPDQRGRDPHDPAQRQALRLLSTKAGDVVAWHPRCVGAGGKQESGISARVCADLDADDMEEFRVRSGAHARFPYGFSDAAHLKGWVSPRPGGAVRSYRSSVGGPLDESTELLAQVDAGGAPCAAGARARASTANQGSVPGG